jgi:hypothetical protein
LSPNYGKLGSNSTCLVSRVTGDVVSGRFHLYGNRVNQSCGAAISDTTEFDVGNNETLRFTIKTKFDVAPIGKAKV